MFSAGIFVVLVVCLTGSSFAKPPVHIPPKNPNDPVRLPPGTQKSVLIIGGGLSGLSAALELAERGYSVTIKERDPRIGGKLFSIPVEIFPGEKFYVEHGFHAWFYNYYQFRDIRERLNITGNFKRWDRVNYIFRHYKPEEIYSKGPYPLNLLGIIARSPNLKLTDAILSTLSLPDMVYYDFDHMWDKYDDISFHDWAIEKKVAKDFYDIIMAPSLSVTLNNREIFSAAEMLMFMQIYFLTNAEADFREVATKDFYTAVLKPWVDYLLKLNVNLEFEKEVLALNIDDSFRVTGTRDKSGTDPVAYDHVILTTDVGSTQKIINSTIQLYRSISPKIAEVVAQINSTSIGQMKIAPPYKVLRVWFDKQLNSSAPAILETSEFEPVNLVVQFNLLEDESNDWAQRTGGSIIEFHCYTWTDNFDPNVPDSQVWSLIAPTVKEIYPEIFDRQFKVLGYHVNSYRNFASFERGLYRFRPMADTLVKGGLANVYMAGDWIRAPFPAALMERAVSTGRLAANECLIRDKVRQVDLTVVNPKGPGLL